MLFRSERRTHRGLGNDYGPLPIDLFVCRVEASKKTKGGWAECPKSTQKTDSKTDHEMDIPAFYESNINNSNRGPTCDSPADKAERDSGLGPKATRAGLQKILWIGVLMRNVG